MMQKIWNKKNNGFTFVELMVTVTVIGILAAIAIPNFLKYRRSGFNASAQGDARNAYTAAQNYFNDVSTKTLSSINELKAYGYVATPGVVFSTVSGDQKTLILVVYHDKGDETYTVNAIGEISD